MVLGPLEGVLARLLGLFLAMAMLIPVYNVGIPTYAIPFQSDVSAYAYGRGDSCLDSLGLPPMLGIYGACNGWVTRDEITQKPDGWENDALEDAYRTAGVAVTISGPSYGAGRDSRAGANLAVGEYPTGAVIVVGITGLRAVERPTGAALLLGLLSPVLMLFGVGVVFWPRRRPPAQPRQATAAVAATRE